MTSCVKKTQIQFPSDWKRMPVQKHCNTRPNLFVRVYTDTNVYISLHCVVCQFLHMMSFKTERTALH